MAGRYITKEQVKLYMKNRQNKNLTQAASAAKSGISTRSAYTIEQGQHHTQHPHKVRHYKTRRSIMPPIFETENLFD